jgi:hypothetical protein
MPDEPELDPLHHADLLEVIRMRDSLEESGAFHQRVKEATEQALGRIAREFYPGMNTGWQAEQFRKLQEHLSFLATLHWQELASLDSAAKQSLEKSEGK